MLNKNRSHKKPDTTIKSALGRGFLVFINELLNFNRFIRVQSKRNLLDKFYLYLLYDTLIIFMDYTLNQLQIFLKVVENKSITKTAEELYMTQPAVSIQLKNFQHQFSIPLTE